LPYDDPISQVQKKVSGKSTKKISKDPRKKQSSKVQIWSKHAEDNQRETTWMLKTDGAIADSVHCPHFFLMLSGSAT